MSFDLLFILAILFLSRAKHVWFDNPSPETHIGSSSKIPSSKSRLWSPNWQNMPSAGQAAKNSLALSRLAQGRHRSRNKLEKAKNGRFKGWRGSGVAKTGRDGWNQLYYKFYFLLLVVVNFFMD